MEFEEGEVERSSSCTKGDISIQRIALDAYEGIIILYNWSLLYTNTMMLSTTVFN